MRSEDALAAAKGQESRQDQHLSHLDQVQKEQMITLGGSRCYLVKGS